MNKRALIFVICCSLVFFLVVVLLAVFVPNNIANAEDNARINSFERIDDSSLIDYYRDYEDSSDSYFRLKNLEYVFEDERILTRANASFNDGYVYVFAPGSADIITTWYLFWQNYNSTYVNFDGYFTYCTPLQLMQSNYFSRKLTHIGNNPGGSLSTSTQSNISFRLYSSSLNTYSQGASTYTQAYDYSTVCFRGDGESSSYAFNTSYAKTATYPWNLTTLSNNEYYLFLLPSSYNGGTNNQDFLDIFGLFFKVAYTGEVDHTPIVSADTIDINFNTLYQLNELAPDDGNNYIATGFKVVNANEYLDSNDNCAVDFYYTFVENGNTIVYQGSMNLCHVGSLYYLVMLFPSVHAGNAAFCFDGFDDWYTIDTSSNLNSTIKNAFVLNGSRFNALINAYGVSFYNTGYNLGYNAGYNEQNNLLSVMWATFNMPIRILFGTYDSVTDSYSGGLFTFTIFGLDVRAFVLGILSLVLVVRIISVVLGGKSHG